MASGAYPFGRVWAGLCHQTGDPDVFPGRSAPRLRPDFPEHGGCRRARAAHLSVRSGAERGGVGARLPLRPGAARPRRHPDRPDLRGRPAMADKLIPTPSQTVGPFFHLGMARAEWSDLTADDP